MLARSIGGPIGWRFLVAMVTRLRASYESRLVVLFAFPQVLPILAKGEDADEGEKSEGQDGEAGIGGGRIDHAEGDGGVIDEEYRTKSAQEAETKCVGVKVR